jgi:glycine/D-amino acid oxidase-like deaminating enzyme
MNGTNSSAKHYDMVVIGSGAAGHHGANQAAKLGKKIAVVERSIALGGASINTGTIPGKTQSASLSGLDSLSVTPFQSIISLLRYESVLRPCAAVKFIACADAWAI